MPDIRIDLVSQRGRKVDDKPESLEFRGSRFVHPRDIKLDRGFVLVDLVPGRYEGVVDIDGFHLQWGKFSVKKTTRKLKWVMNHRCVLMPIWSDLDGEQQRLFRTFAGGQSAAALWKSIGDNQACTFFQLSYALARTTLGATALSNYIQKVKITGGANTYAKALSGKMRKAAGWRLHVVIKPRYRETIVEDLKKAGFKKDRLDPVPTHSRYGFVKSFRQKGTGPLFQIVLKKDGSGADVDLDRGEWVHQSSPHAIYRPLRKRFPDIHKIYRVR